MTTLPRCIASVHKYKDNDGRCNGHVTTHDLKNGAKHCPRHMPETVIIRKERPKNNEKYVARDIAVNYTSYACIISIVMDRNSQVSKDLERNDEKSREWKSKLRSLLDIKDNTV